MIWSISLLKSEPEHGNNMCFRADRGAGKRLESAKTKNANATLSICAGSDINKLFFFSGHSACEKVVCSAILLNFHIFMFDSGLNFRKFLFYLYVV